MTSLLAAAAALASTVPAWGAEPDYHARLLCSITDPRITESSGLAAAGQSIYTLNDGGDALVVYVLDRSCRVRQVISDPTDPYDVEDLARTPDGTLWLCDTGDNDEKRGTVAVETLRPGRRAQLFRFRYPDGPHDAEALLLDRRHQPFIVTKNPLGASGVYAPATTMRAGVTTVLRRVTDLQFTPTGTAGGAVGFVSQLLVTGGAVSADGRQIALRTYTDLYLWDAPDGDIATALRSGHPRRVPLPATRQGEAVTFDGDALLTSTEGSPAPVHELVPTQRVRPSTAAPVPTAAATSESDGHHHRAVEIALGVAVLAGVVLLLRKVVR